MLWFGRNVLTKLFSLLTIVCQDEVVSDLNILHRFSNPPHCHYVDVPWKNPHFVETEANIGLGHQIKKKWVQSTELQHKKFHNVYIQNKHPAILICKISFGWYSETSAQSSLGRLHPNWRYVTCAFDCSSCAHSAASIGSRICMQRHALPPWKKIRWFSACFKSSFNKSFMYNWCN